MSVNEETAILLIKGLLKITNYTILSDYPGDNQSEWIAYRAALRALPQDLDWPNVTFPTVPEEPPLIAEE